MRPTSQGWQAIFFGTLTFAAACVLGTTQLYQLAYALAGLLFFALVLGLFLSRGLRYTRRVPAGERPVAGCPSRVELSVSNDSRTLSLGVEVVDHLPGRCLFEAPPIAGLQTTKLVQSALFPRRGLYELGPAWVRTTDPFGLLRFIRRSEEPMKVMVYPRVFDLKGFPPGGRSAEMGAAQGILARQGHEFSSLREYRHGDDRRHIHWKSVAHTGELVVKEFAHHASRRHTIILDLHRPVFEASEAEIEDAISAAGSVTRRLAREGLPFCLLRTNEARVAIGFDTGETAFWRAMDLLARARADGAVSLGDYLDETLHEGLGEVVVIVSRSLDDGLVRSVKRLGGAGASVLVVALAVHTYRAGGAPRGGREDAFSGGVQRLERAGAKVGVVRRPGGIAAFAREKVGMGAV
ncbi:MAG TPA: DUF58 domain-containing protein [Rubrobacteraceae bacterium]|nr:DUF58 domain-containing protein [Rubrobacteraceae bacterium]